MDVFELDQKLIGDYERFARSFTQIRASDIREQVEAIYASGRFWPDPLISINPHFKSGASIEELVTDGSLHPETGRVFRIDGAALTLHTHQAQAVAKAAARQSFVVTTGTGSGKSLCFFIPIIDAAIRARAAREPRRTRAIVVYPMNALANSQLKELEKFINDSGLPENLRPAFARYTGQETEEEREVIRNAKPDILLTNFMMLELLMTRQNARDRDVIAAAEGLDFLVLDELHTYRGRQGADVAMLVRRVRDRLCQQRAPICIGTSATMASEGGDLTRAAAVAGVASRLFGTTIRPDAVIDESLERATSSDLKLSDVVPQLAAAVDADLPTRLDDAALQRHPLAVWIELEIGLDDQQRLTRRDPVTVEDAAKRLSAQAGRDIGVCRRRLQEMLVRMSLPAKERGGSGERAFLAFKLHRFISGAGHVYSTLSAPGRRRVTLEGQRFDPQEPDARLYATFFCRNCGQEHHPVTCVDEGGTVLALPRSIDEAPVEDSDGAAEAGYLMPCPDPDQDPDFMFDGSPEAYPEEWTESTAGGLRIKADRRKLAPRRVNVDQTGRLGVGREAWFLPGKFRLCPACGDQPSAQAREINKLAGLSAEGRSSATTLLVSSAIRWMNRAGSTVPEGKRKLLGFTDNRQDAALQAGNFNDFIFVSLLRGAVLAAIESAGPDGLPDEDFGRLIRQKLGFTAEHLKRRQEWMINPDAKGAAVVDAERALTRVLSYRTWADQRRGWRFTNPNLEQLGLVRARYVSLDDLAADDAAFADGPDALRRAAPDVRSQAINILLDAMRGGLAITCEALDAAQVESTSTLARQHLRDPWSISSQETPRTASALMIDAPRRADTTLADEPLVLRAGPRSGLARDLNRKDLWGDRLKADDYRKLVSGLLEASESYGLVQQVATRFDQTGWRLRASAVRLVPGDGTVRGRGQPNPYFADLYRTLAATLDRGGEGLFGLEAREHTAQVDQERREWREWRFRDGPDDHEHIEAERQKMVQAGEPTVFLPVLFCSPTMELGVDISALNAVYLRNAPPTPANYAQRSGRAGRSGQAALIVTYCAAQSPHDQYYFARPNSLVKGIVRPPALELANRELITSHLHAVWLGLSDAELQSAIPGVLDLTSPDLPVATAVEEQLSQPRLTASAITAMKRILDSVSGELSATAAPWAQDREALAEGVAISALDEFRRAFDRWRQLYQGARAQLQDANRRSEMHGLSAEDRREAKIQQAQANEQIALLERGASSGGSDFYTYRYLATEGFLPGYNFPRLPLYAYVPSVVGASAQGTYLQRARFLAISEFGPGSLIYHEGRAFRVVKAKLPAGLRGEEGGRLATSQLFVCDDCGAAHERDEPERCHACGASMGGVKPIRNILRIDNVETRARERITANDEERQRQGFDIQTVFAWPRRDGRVDVSNAIAADAAGPIAHLSYASGATISRVNKGLRRRSDKSVTGFGIDPANGRWVGAPDGDFESTPDEPIRQRVVPIVQDNKNALLLRLAEAPLDDAGMTTLQHALARGLEIVFQLEEGETQTEPAPSRDNRRAVLAYEATEGGAGVLSRLISEPDAMAKVAREALKLMHLVDVDEAVRDDDPGKMLDDPAANCVKGCYRCLLSYFNQPDHEAIDRTNAGVIQVLFRLAGSSVTPLVNQTAEGGWQSALVSWGMPRPDNEPLRIGDVVLPLAWRAHLIAASFGAFTADLKSQAEAMGYTLTFLPSEPGETPPVELLDLLGCNR